MGQAILLLGGARSGKSTFAENLAEGLSSDVTYLATAAAGDEEMEQRIADHQARRPITWQTREINRQIATVLQQKPIQSEVIVLDCITFLVTNILLAHTLDVEDLDATRIHAEVHAEIDALLQTIRASASIWIIVSNEVGAGLVPPYPSGRIFRDAMGWANQALARAAARAYLMVAGQAVPLFDRSVSIEDVVKKLRSGG